MIYDIFLIFLSLEVNANVLPKRIRGPDWPYLGLNPPLFRHNPIGVRNIKPGMPLPMPNLRFMPILLLKNDASSSSSSSSSEENDNLHLNLENIKSRKNLTKLNTSFLRKSKFVKHVFYDNSILKKMFIVFRSKEL